jgi:hypothetical protein
LNERDWMNSIDCSEDVVKILPPEPNEEGAVGDAVHNCSRDWKRGVAKRQGMGRLGRKTAGFVKVRSC